MNGGGNYAIDPKGYAAYVRLVRLLFLVVNVGIVILNSYFLYYVYQIDADGCDCALGWRRSFIEASLVLFVVMGIVGIVVDWEDHFVWLSAIYQGLIIAYIIVTREFINEMRSHACRCAQTRAFEVLNVVSIIGLFLLGVSLLALVCGVVIWAMTQRSLVSSSGDAEPAAVVRRAAGARRRS